MMKTPSLANRPLPYLVIVLCLLSLVVAACRNSDGMPVYATGIIHPTPENIPDDAQLASVIYRTDGIQGESTLHEVARKLLRMEEILVIGRNEGDRYDIIGKVEDLARDDQGNVYLLDSRYNEVRVYDPQGAFVRAFGGPGRGPNEFQAPEALELEATGRLIITDRLGEIKIFEPEGASFVRTQTIFLSFDLEDTCLLDSLVLVQGFKQDEGTLHAFTTTGEPVRSFGPPYKAEDPFVENQLSSGLIACSEAAQTVVTAFKFFPVLSGYSPEGELRWQSRLADFEPMKITQLVDDQGRKAVRYGWEGDYHDVVKSMVGLPGGYVIIQTARSTRASSKARQEYAELRTYVLSAATGEGIYVGSSLPEIHAVTQDQILSGVNDPFPQIKVYGISQEGVK